MNIPQPDPNELKEALSLDSVPAYIATGGFKVVFKHTSTSGDDEALKAVYIPAASTDEETLQRNQLIARAKREIAALNECRHPNIVKLGSIPAELKTIGKHDFLIYSEEFLPGGSLNAWLVSPDPAWFYDLHSLMGSLVDLIAELSDSGLLHRDIKPDNIIETTYPERRFVVLDMGIAYKMQGTELTRGGSPPGTLRYMAPELLKPDYKDNMDFRCDLYSAGLTVYVLATKAHPFAPKPEDAYATVYRILKTHPEPLASRRPDLPRKFSEIIDRCIRKRPALRYGNLNHLKSELEGVSL